MYFGRIEFADLDQFIDVQAIYQLEDKDTFNIRVRVSVRRRADLSGLSVVFRLEVVAVVVSVFRIGILSRLDECAIFDIVLKNI